MTPSSKFVPRDSGDALIGEACAAGDVTALELARRGYSVVCLE